MKIICIADLQGYCSQIKPSLIPDGDMLIVAGDLCGNGTIRELGVFNNWLGQLPHKYKVVVGGNHDQCLREVDGHTFLTGATHYLQDELVEIEGLRIFGSPMNEMNEYRTQHDWAFCDPKYIKQVCKNIPKDLDILITHGPAYGTLDKLSDGRHVGSKDLMKTIEKMERPLRANYRAPKIHVFGHIHESAGQDTYQVDTWSVNAALCNEDNELFREDGKLINEPQWLEMTKGK